MATIGSISVAFEANLKGLESGIEEAIDLFDDLTEAAEGLKEQLSNVSETRVSLKVDSSGLSKAKSDIDDLQRSASSTQPVITATAETSSISDAAEETERLGESIAQTAAVAAQSRSAVAQLVVTTARISAAATAATQGYRALRDGTLAYISATTGAVTASQRALVINAALRGEYTAVMTVLGGVSSTIASYAQGLFTAEGAANAMQAGLRVVLSSLGVTDAALISSIQYLSQFSISQTAAAATTRLSQRSIGVLSEALDGTADAFARFYSSSAGARSVGDSLSAGFIRVLRVAVPLNNEFNVASARVGLFLSRFNVAGAVSATVGTAFDKARAALEGLASGSTTISSLLATLGQRMASLVPTSSAVASTLTRVAATSATLVGVFGRLWEGLNLIRAGSRESAEGFMGLLARTAATSAGIGAASGALAAWSAGTAVATGAAAGAAGALSTMAAAFPVTAGFAIAAAVATGRFAHELEELSVQAQQVEQMADRFGAPRQEIDKLRMAAANTGVGLSQLAKGQQSFYTSLSKIKTGQLNVENVREAKLAFDKLGISMNEVKSRSPDQVFALVAEELQKIEDPAKKTQLAFDLFGKQGAAILPALKEFGELSSDFDRLGGSISDVDFSRFLSLEQSFDRLKAATSNLATALITPFVPLQQALNNFWADIKGGATAALSPIATAVADATVPFATLIEIAGRFIGVLLRIIGVVASIAASLQIFAALSMIFDGIKEAVFAAIKPIEEMVMQLQAIANVIASRISPITPVFKILGNAIGGLIGGVIQLAAMVAIGAAAWVTYSVVMGVVNIATLTAAASAVVMWAAFFAPAAAVIAVLAVIGASLVFVGKLITDAATRLLGLGKASESVKSENIKAATVSVDELAAASKRASDAVNNEAAKKAWAEMGTAAGYTAEQVDTAVAYMRSSVGAIAGESISKALFGSDKTGPSVEEIKKSVEEARGAIGGLTIDAARFGTAGADAANEAQSSFNELQKQLASGQIDLPTFEEESAKIAKNLEDNLKILADDSPEITLKKNLELFKQLDDAAKSARKSVRDIGADVQIGDKIFPRSSEVKARAKQFQDEYVAALEAIKQKQQAGDFGRELTAKKKKNEDDFNAGRISREQFQKVKLELDSTSAQEQASNAAEDVQREFERKKVKLEADLSFADNIRKELETAFLSPVEKFQKELKKIQDNPELTGEEKAKAEKNLRKQAREGLIGKTASEQFNERTRDVTQAADAGLISPEEMQAELLKSADALAQALGIPVDPSNAFGASVIALDEALKAGTISADQHAKGIKAARDKMLAELGIEKPKTEQDNERFTKLQEQLLNRNITGDEFARGKKAIENEIVGQSAGDKFKEQRDRITNAMSQGIVGQGRGEAALRSLDTERKKSAGVELTAGEQVQSGVDKINDIFGVTGKSLSEIQATLSPKEFADYQEALKKNNEAVRASLGIEKSGAQQLADTRKKLDQAVADGVITEEEKNKALKQQKDSLLSSLGITKSPSQDFEDAVAKIKENAAALSPEELAKGLKEAKDKLLESLGVPKSPAQTMQEAMDKLNEAFKKGQISAEEFAKGAQNAKDALLQSLGIPLDPVVQLGKRLNDLQEAFSKGLITQEEFTRGQEEAKRTMLPGGEDESPVKKFKRDMEAIDKAVAEGLITEEEGNDRRKNLQAKLQEDLKPALDRLAPDRRQVESSDVRSKAGVDTFFRILRGNDNPSLKAQLEIARNTRLLAEAADTPEAAPVLLNMQGR